MTNKPLYWVQTTKDITRLEKPLKSNPSVNKGHQVSVCPVRLPANHIAQYFRNKSATASLMRSVFDLRVCLMS